MKNAAQTFNTFPKFSKLTYADREKYEDLIKDFPPLAICSFPVLMTWWNQMDGLRISQLNGNLVYSYWIPGVDSISGLSILGNRHIDDTICTIFDHMVQKGEKPQLVHVPEFVISNMQYPDLFEFEEERAHDECILTLEGLSKLENIPPFQKAKIQRFIINYESKGSFTKELDLGIESNREQILELAEAWRDRGGYNSIYKSEQESFEDAVMHFDELGLECIAVFIDGQIHGFVFYSCPQDEDYVLLNYARFSYDIPFLFEYCAYAFAKYFAKARI